MDLEKVKNSYKWDPMGGDYSKSYVSYERRIVKRNQSKKILLTTTYIIVLVAIVTVIFIKFL